ncbi:type II secretion system secretin GspD [Jannaschia pohangensis]|uniref:General secretion pathway protein D n=1 Tax=Jannaschia pohangensis TaxID=390807 RepID=A0A1I3JYV0_9RHOB|nr:type II secretion system secretin GspD [Jannaschia pohangensis]SFI65346.1 general secretion pathway protein D [Jannaschia pohangensis]
MPLLSLQRPGRALLVFSAVAFLSGCIGGDPQASRTSPLLANLPGGESGGNSAADRFRAAFDGPTGSQRRLGTDRFSNLPEGPNRDPISVSEDGAFTLNLVDVPIEEAARAVLGTALKKTYTVQPGVGGAFTLQTSRPLSERELLETFQAVLEINDATLQVSDDLFTILPRAGAAQRIARPGEASPIGTNVIAVPLQFIATAEMVRLLEPIAGEGLRLQAIPNRNILLVSGTRTEIDAALEAINLFDVDVMEGKSVGVYRLRAAEPEAVVEELRLIFENQEGGSLQNLVTFVPSKRLGAVIVITSRSRYLAEAERWVRDLDRTAGGTRRRPVVYDMQNRSAEDLAPILGEMLAEVSEEEGLGVDGQARVVADDTRNAIIVWGNDGEQESFSRLISELDSTPVQVLLEATIAEVSLNDELDFGLRYFFESGDLRGTFTDSGSGSVGANFPGLSFVFQGSSASVALNALASVTDVNVVSSPSLMVLDNQEARLQIGDEVPIATQQVVDTADVSAPVVNTISFRDTGIILQVEPRVSSSGQVILDIEQEVSSVSSTTTSGIDSPTISTRRVETTVVVGDGQTIALGGLIQESGNRTNSKVPGLGDAPVVGALFRNRSDRVQKTELLILITPRVIRNGHESRSTTTELRRRLGGADGLIRTGIAVPTTGHRIGQP